MTAVCWEKCHNACWSLEEKTIGLEAVRPAVPEANDLLFTTRSVGTPRHWLTGGMLAAPIPRWESLWISRSPFPVHKGD